MKFSISTALLAFTIYIVFTGSATLYDIVTGFAVAAVVGFVAGKYVVVNESKVFNPVRWFWALVFFLKYITVTEIKAHIEVIKILFTGKYNPGIVRIPVSVKTDYAKLLVAFAITNTPGTVVVDTGDNIMYVNWINVTTTDPVEARKKISSEFEKYAERIFD